MRDKGKQPTASDKDILAETLKSLQDLIREVDEYPGPESSAPPLDPDQTVIQQPAATEVDETRIDTASATTLELNTVPVEDIDIGPPTNEPPENGDTLALDPPREEEPIIEWFSSLTESSPAKMEASLQPKIIGSQPDDVPLLQDIAIVPTSPGPTIPVDDSPRHETVTPESSTRLDPITIAALAHEFIGLIEDELQQKTNDALDADSRTNLRQQIYTLLEDWTMNADLQQHDQDENNV